VLLCDGNRIELEHLDLRASEASQISEGDLATVEQRHILSTLERTDGNRTEAAKRLGITARTLRNKLKEFGT